MLGHLVRLIITAVSLAPGAASAEYLCEKAWNEKYGAGCPAGSSWDAGSGTCVING